MMNKGIETLIGAVPIQVTQDGDYRITITFDDGRKIKFFHEQDCCEDVHIEDVNGDWADLIGVPLLVMEARESEEELGPNGHSTWAFYTFRSIKGSVDVRWCGVSNGYYSERVDYAIVKEGV